MRAMQILLQLIGGLALLLAAAVAVLVVSTNDLRLRDDASTATRDEVRFVLNWGGLNADQDYKVVYSFQSRRSLLGDFIDYHCLQLEDFSPGARTASAWVPGPEQNPIMEQARDIFAATGKIHQCFGQNAADEPEIAFLLWQLELTRTHELSVEEPHITGGEAIFFHQPTSRLLYVGFQT